MQTPPHIRLSRNISTASSEKPPICLCTPGPPGFGRKFSVKFCPQAVCYLTTRVIGGTLLSFTRPSTRCVAGTKPEVHPRGLCYRCQPIRAPSCCPYKAQQHANLFRASNMPHEGRDTSESSDNTPHGQSKRRSLLLLLLVVLLL